MPKITHTIPYPVAFQEEFDAILNWDRTAIIIDDIICEMLVGSVLMLGMR